MKREIEAALGEVPPFLAVAEGTPELLESFRRQHRAAYLESPLPAVFKEKLAASLSRFCRHPYPLILHACALRRQGLTAAEILHLLERPIPGDHEPSHALWSMRVSEAPLAHWPEPGSPVEAALLQLSIEVYLGRPQAEACRVAVQRLLGLERDVWSASLLSHEAGFDSHVVKPVDPQELARLLGTAASRQ